MGISEQLNSKIYFSKMGNQCQCVQVGPEVSQDSIDKIRDNFYLGLMQQKIDINEAQKVKINTFINDPSTFQANNTNHLLFIKDENGVEIKLYKIINTTIYEAFIVVKLIRADQSQIIDRQDKFRGLVVYNSGFYAGQIAANYPDGMGSFYFMTQNMKNIVVKGIWHEGRIDEVSVFRQNIKQLEIQLKSKDKAKLTFFDPLNSNKPLYYEGTIKWNIGDQAVYFSTIMTGKGKIYFPNGDVYEGEVLNSKMHTGSEGESVYYSEQSKTRFFGCFKEGKRCGKGRLQIQVDKFKEVEDQIYELNVEYYNGKLVRAGQLKSTISGQHWHQLVFQQVSKSAKKQLS